MRFPALFMTGWTPRGASPAVRDVGHEEKGGSWGVNGAAACWVEAETPLLPGTCLETRFGTSERPRACSEPQFPPLHLGDHRGALLTGAVLCGSGEIVGGTALGLKPRTWGPGAPSQEGWRHARGGWWCQRHSFAHALPSVSCAGGEHCTAGRRPRTASPAPPGGSGPGWPEGAFLWLFFSPLPWKAAGMEEIRSRAPGKGRAAFRSLAGRCPHLPIADFLAPGLPWPAGWLRGQAGWLPCSLNALG